MKDDTQCLGTIYNYWTNAGYHPLGKGTVYDSKSYSFKKSTTNDFMRIDYIAQDVRVSNAWTTLTLHDSKVLQKQESNKLTKAQELSVGSFSVHNLKQEKTYLVQVQQLMHKNCS